MLRKLQFIFFTCQKYILAHFCKLPYKDRDLWWPNKYRVACFSHFIPAEVKKILRKSQPQIREKLRKLSLRKKSVFLIKKTCISVRIHISAKPYQHELISVRIHISAKPYQSEPASVQARVSPSPYQSEAKSANDNSNAEDDE